MQDKHLQRVQGTGFQPYALMSRQISGRTQPREVGRQALTVRRAAPLPPLEPALSGVQPWPMPITSVAAGLFEPLLPAAMAEGGAPLRQE